eukprot:SM000324S12582  [mRNA]  locus=s324:51717:53911:+ [translate_table: standard]
MKVSSEFDSEDSFVVNKLSARILGGAAKLKASFQVSSKVECRYPLLALVTKHFTVDYDVEDRNALVSVFAAVGKAVRLTYRHDVKEACGSLVALARSDDQRFQAQAFVEIPPSTLGKAVLTFPNGELKCVRDELNQAEPHGWSGFGGLPTRNGLAFAEFQQEDPTLNLKYTYKDEGFTVTPAVSLPRRSLLVAVKRQFDVQNKLSFLYDFQTVTWNAVYKYKPSPNIKAKVGYDSEQRLGWACCWVGKEDSGAAKAPGKCKVQMMLQVPQDDILQAFLLFKVKKRWDFDI